MAKEEKKEEKKILNLEEFTDWAKKLQGKDSIKTGIELETYRDFIPITPLSLRTALGIGGYAIGKIHTIDGESSGGKSTICYDAIGNSQKKFGKPCLLIDKEDSYTPQYGELFGIDNSNLIISCPHSLDEMYEIIIKALETKLFGCIVADSVTAFAPQARFEGSEQMGLESRMNSDKMRIVNDVVKDSDTALFMIQQIRSKMGGFGDPTTVSGGLAIPFYASTRTRITRSEINRELGQNTVKFTIIKNKLNVPFKVGTVVYKWGFGFDAVSEYAELSIEFGIIKSEGKFYTPPETDIKINGKKKMVQYLKDNPDYTKNVIEPLVLKYLESTGLRTDEIDDNELT